MIDEHVWFRHRLADHLLDLLDESATRNFLAHAEACAGCAALLAAARARNTGWPDTGHPSPAVLLRWQERTLIDDEEARIVSEHVDFCASCQADLEELAGSRVVRPAVAPTGDSSVPAAPRSRRGSWAWSALGGGLATAAAFLIAWPRAPQTVAEAPPVTRSEPRPAKPEVELLATDAPVLIRSVSRGGADTTRVGLGENRGLTPLRIPALFLPDSTRVRVELLDASGVAIAHTVVTAEVAERSGVLLDTRALEPGELILRISWQRDGGEESRRYPIQFRAGP